MIGKLVSSFLALPVAVRYALILLSLPALIPTFLVGGLLYSMHQIIEIFKE